MMTTQTTEETGSNLTQQILAMREMLVASEWAMRDARMAFEACDSDDDAAYNATFAAMDEAIASYGELRRQLQAAEFRYLVLHDTHCPVNPGWDCAS